MLEQDWNAARQPRKGLRFEHPTHLSVTADATLTTNDPEFIHLDATAGIMTVTLPTPYLGLVYHLSEIAGLATAITIDAGAGLTVNGARMATMNTPYAQRKLRGISATAWIIVGEVS